MPDAQFDASMAELSKIQHMIRQLPHGCRPYRGVAGRRRSSDDAEPGQGAEAVEGTHRAPRGARPVRPHLIDGCLAATGLKIEPW